jgi:hypothetical protein
VGAGERQLNAARLRHGTARQIWQRNEGPKKKNHENQTQAQVRVHRCDAVAVGLECKTYITLYPQVT